MASRTVTRWRLLAYRVLTLIGIVAILTAALRLGLAFFLDLQYEPRYWVRDFVGNVVVSLVLLGITHRLLAATLLSIVVIGGFQISNALKLVILGTPISPDDFLNVRNLFKLWDGVLLAALVGVGLLPVLLIAWLVRWRSVVTVATLVLVGSTVAFAVVRAETLRPWLDKQFGNSVWNQPANFYSRGLGLHIAQETVRTIAKIGDVPSSADVAAIREAVPAAAVATSRLERRNVHMIVLETFFDPMRLGKDIVPDDPFDPALRALWAEAGFSRVLSPVFGGYTANAEFEALCGLPITEHAVFFEGWLRRAAPCLPDVLRKAGYATVASHPNVAGFWNRTYAYRLVGFDHYWSKSAFDMTESAGNFLVDSSYYEQAFERLERMERQEDQPVFNYMLTIYGHLPYPADPRWPTVVAAGREDGLLNGYLNHVYYKSRDFMAMLADLRRDDPDALIVMFGDHLPYLGPNYAIFDEVLDLPDDRMAFTGEMFEYLVSTPLIVIDGQRGVLPLGDLPLYRLPALILERLGVAEHGIMGFTENPEGLQIRPVYGMHYNRDAAGALHVCPPERRDDIECRESQAWMDRMRILSADIFSGEQHSLDWLGRDTPEAPAPASDP